MSLGRSGRDRIQLMNASRYEIARAPASGRLGNVTLRGRCSKYIPGRGNAAPTRGKCGRQSVIVAASRRSIYSARVVDRCECRQSGGNLGTLSSR